MTERTPEQRFYDTNGYYERQTHDPAHESTYLAWARDFDNSPRHCWESRDGTRTLDNRVPEYDHDLTMGENICTVEHDPRLTGSPEWLRFVREYGALAPEGKRYFTDDGQLWINPTGLPTSTGRLMYAEAYFNQRPHDTRQLPGFSTRLKFAVFIANGEKYARIECYDESLLDLCQQAMLAVEASYEVPA
jgi:hypothetical protein